MTATSLADAQVIAPSSRAEAVEAFGDGTGVTVLGGGTILMPELNYGRLRPERVLLLQNAGLSGIARNGTSLTIGAMTTVAELDALPICRSGPRRATLQITRFAFRRRSEEISACTPAAQPRAATCRLR